jgi:peptide/nickel transport system substrate-binding protein
MGDRDGARTPRGDLDLRYWGRQRVTRRRVLAGAVSGGAALGAIALVGCSSGKKSGTNGGSTVVVPTTTINDGYQDGPGQPGGILRVRQATALPSMNVFGPGILILAQGLTLGFTVFDHLWYVPTDTGELELFLATNVEQPDDQGLELIVTIGDAAFHDKDPINGRKVTAEDVVESFLRFKAEPPIGYSWLQDVMKSIEVVDEKTLRITQNFPWAWVFTSSNAGSPIFTSIMPKEILRDHDDLLLKDAIGSGHWVLDGHDNGANIRFRKFQNFRTFQNGRDITGQPYLNGVDFVFITDENAGLAAFVAGEIDTTGFTSRKQMEDTAADMGDRIVTGSDLSRDYVNLMLNVKNEPLFNDERIRKAFNKLIDREEAILLLEEGDAQRAGPIPPAHKRYLLSDDDPDLVEYWTHDVQGAKQLLDAAAFDYDKEFELKHSNRPVDSQLAQVLKDHLGRGGVKLKLVQEDLVKWFSETLNQHNFSMTCFQHLPYEDVDLPLRFYMGADTSTGRPANFMDYKDPDVDAACLAAAQELDEEARVEKVREAQRVIMRKAAPMFNLHSAVNFGARYAYVKGSISGRGSYGLFNRTTWLDDEQRRQET